MAFDAFVPASLRRYPTSSLTVQSLGTVVVNAATCTPSVNALLQGKPFYNSPESTKQHRRCVARAPDTGITSARYEALLLSVARAHISTTYVRTWASKRQATQLGLDGLVAVVRQCNVPQRVLGHIVYALGPASVWPHETMGVVPSLIAPDHVSYGVCSRTIRPDEIWHPYQHFVVFFPLT